MIKSILAISQIIKALMAEYPINKNPLELRIFPLLMEMELSISKILSTLNTPIPDKKFLKNALSILYHDDEAAEPLMRGWVRSSMWMENADLSGIKKREDLYKSLRKELKNMVPYVESIFGKEETRYMIPPLMRG